MLPRGHRVLLTSLFAAERARRLPRYYGSILHRTPGRFVLPGEDGYRLQSPHALMERR